MLFKVFNHFIAHKLGAVLLYHSILPQDGQGEGDTAHHVSLENFKRQVLWLKKHYDIISIDEMLSLKDRRGKACVTFDDAYRSIFDQAVPFLIDHQIPTTIFINGATLQGGAFWRDKVRFIMTEGLAEDFLSYREKNWPKAPKIGFDQFYKATKSKGVNSQEIETQIDHYLEENNHIQKLKQMASYIAGPEELLDHPLVTYGNHTLSHYVLSGLSAEEQAHQIKENQKILDQYKLRCSKVFSVPFGGEKDMNEDTKEIIRKSGYIGYLYSRNRVNVACAYDIFSVERFMPDNDMALFHRRLAGATLRSLRNRW